MEDSEYKTNGKTYLIPNDSVIGKQIAQFSIRIILWAHVRRCVRGFLAFMVLLGIVVLLTPLTWTMFLTGLVFLAVALDFFAKDRIRDTLSSFNEDFWKNVAKNAPYPDWVEKE